MCRSHYEAWRKCHKAELREYRRYNPDDVCSVTDCPVTGPLTKGLCERHYNRLLRWGDTDLRRHPHQSGCDAPGCTRRHDQHGYCEYHVRRVRKYGTWDIPPRKVGRSVCSETGCAFPVKSHGLCSKHWSRILRTDPSRRAAETQKNAAASLAQRKSLRETYWTWSDRKCGICLGAIPDPHSAVMDHDHGHCKIGCHECRRGLVHRRCNTLEGYVRAAIDGGIVTLYDGPLAAYLADPPYQRWRSERDVSEDAPLAA